MKSLFDRFWDRRRLIRLGEELAVLPALGGPEDFEGRFWVKIVWAESKAEEVAKREYEEEPMGLPDYQVA